MEPQPTVFVVDDDEAVARSLVWLIESVGLSVRPFSSAQGFLESYDPNQPGCLVLDVRMPGMSGLALQESLYARGVVIPIIFITGHGSVQTAVRAIQGGALDFLEKPFNDQELLDRVQKAIERDRKRRQHDAEHSCVRARRASLTARERQVLDLVVAGKPNKAIASALGLSCKTVEAHRARVMEKMRARSVSDLVKAVLAESRSAETS